ncbi:unnamed protein product [Lactuca saligna]|uniref:Uncharacterized protein n=1 Tax=Lactuca saligna TaxID=75948 RepID=A0AA36DWF5_LACSI|nr:unnamed protein product [Lactuca saligna]
MKFVIFTAISTIFLGEELCNEKIHLQVTHPYPHPATQKLHLDPPPTRPKASHLVLFLLFPITHIYTSSTLDATLTTYKCLKTTSTTISLTAQGFDINSWNFLSFYIVNDIGCDQGEEETKSGKVDFSRKCRSCSVDSS